MRGRIDEATERLANRAALAAAHLLGLATGAHLRKLRALNDPLADFEARLEEAELRARLAWSRGDVEGLQSLLARDVRMLSDGGGEFVAARVPVVGRDKVLRFLFGLARKAGAAVRIDLRSLNGVPAVVLDNPAVPAQWARRTVLLLDLDTEGRIAVVYGVLASRKLTALS